MKQVEPNALQQALSQAQATGVHPDADVLTAFAEGSLLARERTEMIAHLAVCPVCREAVSIAAALAPEPAAGHGLHLVPRSADRPLRKWAPWLGIAAAVTIVSTAVLIHQRTATPKSAVNEVAIVERQSPTPSAPPPSDVPPEQAKPARPASPAPARPEHREAPPSPKPIMVAPPPPLAEPPAVLGRTTPPAAAPSINQQQTFHGPVNETVTVNNSSVQLETESAQATDEVVTGANAQTPEKKRDGSAKSMAPFSSAGLGALAAPRAMAKTVVRPQWRINQDGHPERSFGDGAWHAVLANEPARMRVVSIVANDVWVGGEDQRLFHSIDNGTTWTAVALPARDQKHHAITSIRFTSTQTGTVASDDGTSWATADGGATWQ